MQNSAVADKTPYLIRWRNLVFSENGLPSTTKLVLATLSLHMNKDGGSCFPSIRHLSDRSSLSEKAVCKHIKEAEKDGWIFRRDRITTGKGWRGKSYQAVIPQQYRTDRRSIPREVASSSATPPIDTRADMALTESQSNCSKELSNNFLNFKKIEEQIISGDSNSKSAELQLKLYRMNFREAYEAALVRCMRANRFTASDVKIFCEIENNSRLFGNQH